MTKADLPKDLERKLTDAGYVLPRPFLRHHAIYAMRELYYRARGWHGNSVLDNSDVEMMRGDEYDVTDVVHQFKVRGMMQAFRIYMHHSIERKK